MHGYHTEDNQQALRYLADLTEGLRHGTVTAAAAMAAVAAAARAVTAAALAVAAALWVGVAAAVWE